jgi:hypothetical protein
MTNTIERLFVAGLLAVAPAIAQPASKVSVCVAGDGIPTLVLLHAEAISSWMFATAGVAVEWRSKGSAACRGTQSDGVSIEFVGRAPAALHPGALAYAQLSRGSKIVVMFDRVERSARCSSQVSNVLGHVMTHEITHLLQGVSRHSETGVMKARWGAQDFVLMERHPLRFAPEDIELIQFGLARRAGSLLNSIVTQP